MAYIMESETESARLLKKSDYESSRQQLLMTCLKPGMTSVDAGGGAGFVTKIMAEIVGVDGKAILIDQSKERLEAARDFCKGSPQVSFLQSSLEEIRLDSSTADYVFCRFVFEYLQSPEVVLKELIRIAKPGAKIVVGDLDNNMLTHYPMPETVERQLHEISRELQKAKVWDPYVGRKLYYWFRKAGLENVKIQLLPHHLIYGSPDSRDLENWTAKLDQIERLTAKGSLQLSFDVKEFRKSFLGFFSDPARFSYSPLILVEAVK